MKFSLLFLTITFSSVLNSQAEHSSRDESDLKEFKVNPIERIKIQKLREDEQQALKDLQQNLEEERKRIIDERIKYRRCIGTTWKINYDRLSDVAKKALQFCAFLPSEVIMQTLLYSEDTFNAEIWQELETSSLLSPFMNDSNWN